ncbi:MAG TPA: hypothetical protein VHJ76_06910 [Actinomycetota bacterium]|nr:hypothetical protein [Actinomycetota bacterium]
MDESPELSVLIHELGGVLSSVQGFAHIAAENPGHPDRERFIKLAASEARRAAQTVKDVHLVRSFDRGRIDPSPPSVPLSEVLGGEAGDARVSVDPAKISDVLERCRAQAVAPVAVDGAQLRVPVGTAGELARRTEALDAPYPDMVTWAILRRLMRHWGGDVTLAADGEWTVVTVAFPVA